MLARPWAVVAFSWIVLLPAFTDTVRVLVAHVVQAPVAPNGLAACATEPLTSTSAGRPVVVPLAYRMPMLAVPAAEALTVNCTPAPTALVALQNPLPE